MKKLENKFLNGRKSIVFDMKGKKYETNNKQIHGECLVVTTDCCRRVYFIRSNQ